MSTTSIAPGTGAGCENIAAKALLSIGISHPEVSRKFGIEAKGGRSP